VLTGLTADVVDLVDSVRSVRSQHSQCRQYRQSSQKSLRPQAAWLFALGSNVETKSRPEGAEPNGAEIHSPMYPGRRFALPWAISFCPFGAGKQKTPTARGLSPVSCHVSLLVKRKCANEYSAILCDSPGLSHHLNAAFYAPS